MFLISALSATALLIVIYNTYSNFESRLFIGLACILIAIFPSIFRVYRGVFIFTSIFFFSASALIHGFLNPAFSSDFALTSDLSVSVEGMVHAVENWAWINCFLLASACALSVSRRQLISAFKRVGVNRVILGVVLQAISTMKLIEQRARDIILAQKARGAYREGNIIRNARDSLGILIPLVVVLIRESGERAIIQEFLQSTSLYDTDIDERIFDAKELGVVLFASIGATSTLEIFICLSGDFFGG